jgi:serine/threonine protein kinase
MDSDYEKYLKYKLKYLKLKKMKQIGSGFGFLNFNSNQKRLKSKIEEKDVIKKKRRFAQDPSKLKEEIDMMKKEDDDMKKIEKEIKDKQNISWLDTYKRSRNKIKVGEGGYGKVYLFNYNGENNVVKELKIPTEIKKQNAIKKEYELLKNMQYPFTSHSRYKFEQDNKNYYIMMNNIKDGDLFGYMWEKGNYKSYNKNLSKCLRLFIQMVFINYYFHTNGFIHLDIKPENYMIQKINGKPYIYGIDFGLGACISKKDTSLCNNDNNEASEQKPLNVYRGTPQYVAYSMITDEDKYYQNYSDDYYATVLTFIFIYTITFFDSFQLDPTSRNSDFRNYYRVAMKNFKSRKNLLTDFLELVPKKLKGIFNHFVVNNDVRNENFQSLIKIIKENPENKKQFYKAYHKKQVLDAMNFFEDELVKNYKDIVNNIFNFIDELSESQPHYPVKMDGKTYYTMEEKRDYLIDKFESLLK